MVNKKLASATQFSAFAVVFVAAGCGGGGNSSTTSISASTVTPAAQQAGVDTAKQLFASLRTNLNAIADSRSALEARADLVHADFRTALAPVDRELAGWVALPGLAVEYLGRYKTGAISAPTISLMDRGNCTVFSDGAFTVPATTPANARGIGCQTNKLLATDGTTQRVISQVMEISPGSTPGAFTYSAHTRLDTTVNGALASREVIGNYGNSANRATGTIAYAVSGSGGSYAVKGQLPARTDASGAKLTDYEVWDLNALVANEGSTTTYDLTATMTSWLNNAQRGTIRINPGSRLRMNAAPGAFALAQVQDFSLSVTTQSADSAVTGTLSLADWRSDKTGAQSAPAVTTFTGTLTQAGQPFFNGELKYTNDGFRDFDSTQPLSDNNFLTQTVGLTGALAIPQRPPLKVSLAVATRPGGARNVQAQYDDGTSVISVVGTRAGGAGGLDSATVSSSQGVSVAFTEADLAAKRTVDVKNNNDTVATLDLGTGVIHYADGTFESLK